jgi:hypothetical protein
LLAFLICGGIMPRGKAGINQPGRCRNRGCDAENARNPALETSAQLRRPDQLKRARKKLGFNRAQKLPVLRTNRLHPSPIAAAILVDFRIVDIR